MKKKKNLRISDFIAILVVILFTTGYVLKSCDKSTTKVITNTVVQTDTIVKIDTIVNTIKSTPKVISEYIYINELIDTQSIIEEFYSKRYMIDTVIDDTLITIIVKDTLYKNSIYSRFVDYNVYSKNQIITKTITNTIEPGPYISSGISISTNSYIIGNLYCTKSNNTFGIGYNPINKGIQFTYLRKLKWRTK